MYFNSKKALYKECFNEQYTVDKGTQQGCKSYQQVGSDHAAKMSRI